MATAEKLAEAAINALMEDETLRGDLTDDGFGPVLSWAANVAMQRAGAWLAQPDPHAAMWEGVVGLKALVGGVVGAAESLAPEPLLAVAGPLSDPVDQALDSVDWTNDIDANVWAVVAAIASLPWASTLPGGDAPSAEADETSETAATGGA